MPIALIADNDPGVRGLLSELARRQGFVVREAVDGEAAKQGLEAAGVDLLVCDLDMPKLSGQQLLQWLAQQLEVPIVVVVSGYVEAGMQQALMAQRGVRVVLKKPFDILAFVGLLRGYASELAQRQVATPPVVATGSVVPPEPNPAPVKVEVGLATAIAGKNHFVP
jgi:CheY-like chemotaxis protein